MKQNRYDHEIYEDGDIGDGISAALIILLAIVVIFGAGFAVGVAVS